MDLTQITYAALLAFAICYGGPNWRLSAICVGNFIGTMALSALPLSVGVLDMATIALLLATRENRGYALAAVFVVIVPIYPIGDYFEWESRAIYAIVDAVGFLIIPGILASGSGGHRKRRLYRSRRSNTARFVGGYSAAIFRDIAARVLRKSSGRHGEAS